MKRIAFFLLLLVSMSASIQTMSATNSYAASVVVETLEELESSIDKERPYLTVCAMGLVWDILQENKNIEMTKLSELVAEDLQGRRVGDLGLPRYTMKDKKIVETDFSQALKEYSNQKVSQWMQEATGKGMKLEEYMLDSIGKEMFLDFDVDSEVGVTNHQITKLLSNRCDIAVNKYFKELAKQQKPLPRCCENGKVLIEGMNMFHPASADDYGSNLLAFNPNRCKGICCYRGQYAYVPKTDADTQCCDHIPFYDEKTNTNICCQKGERPVTVVGSLEVVEEGEERMDYNGFHVHSGALIQEKMCCPLGEIGYVNKSVDKNGNIIKTYKCCDTEPVYNAQTDTYSCGCKNGEVPTDLKGRLEDAKMCCPKGQTAYLDEKDGKCCEGKTYRNSYLFIHKLTPMGCCESEKGEEPVDVIGSYDGDQLCCSVGQTAYREIINGADESSYMDRCCDGKIAIRRYTDDEEYVGEFYCCSGELFYNQGNKDYFCDTCRDGERPTAIIGKPSTDRLKEILTKNTPTEYVEKYGRKLLSDSEVSMACCDADSTAYWDWSVNRHPIKCCRGEAYIRTYDMQKKYMHSFSVKDKRTGKGVHFMNKNGIGEHGYDFSGYYSNYEEAWADFKNELKREKYISLPEDYPLDYIYLEETVNDRFEPINEPDYDKPLVDCCSASDSEVVDVIGGISGVKACCKKGQTAVWNGYDREGKCCKVGEEAVELKEAEYPVCCQKGSAAVMEKWKNSCNLLKKVLDCDGNCSQKIIGKEIFTTEEDRRVFEDCCFFVNRGKD